MAHRTPDAQAELVDRVCRHGSRIVIAGVPRSGKTYISLEIGERLAVKPRHTDALITSMDWSQVSRHIADMWIDEPAPSVIEGVAMPRALRKWLADHDGQPCDVVLWIASPWDSYRVRGHAAMAKGCATVWRQIAPDLAKRGVEIVTA